MTAKTALEGRHVLVKTNVGLFSTHAWNLSTANKVPYVGIRIASTRLKISLNKQRRNLMSISSL